MEVNGQLQALAALTWGNGPRYAVYSRVGGPQRRSGRYGEEKSSLGCPALA
jgi:hypothetical protein